MTNNSVHPDNQVMQNLTLGKTVGYAEHYAPELLQGVPRHLNRTPIGIDATLPFSGWDMWNGYELSWLTPKGKPVVALLRCWVPCTSENLIESKSFKLYLNSYNQTVFNSLEDVCNTLTQDLSQCAKAQVKVLVTTLEQANTSIQNLPAGTNIDHLDIEVPNYQLDSQVLTCAHEEEITESINSNLLKSNCLITNQPDWGSVFIEYHGRAICHESLLRYLISFRQHNEFHEQCVERIFVDIMKQCTPNKLTVYACYTRRGGLDINPMRTNDQRDIVIPRLIRQ